MLILPIKSKWFNMILSGDKQEEYREIKPYYTKTKHNTHKLGNLGYGIYENCVLCNNPCIIGKIGRIKKSDRIGHNRENGGLRYGRI